MLSGFDAVNVGAITPVLFCAIGVMSVGAGPIERLVRVGLELSLEERPVGTGMDTMEPNGEFAFEAAALEIGGTIEELGTSVLAALGFAVALKGAVDKAVEPTNGAAPELAAEESGIAEAEIEKPVDVRVAVVVGEANKTVLELRTVSAFESDVAGPVVEGTKLESVGAILAVAELSSKDVESSMELCVVGIGGSTAVEVGTCAELGVTGAVSDVLGNGTIEVSTLEAAAAEVGIALELNKELEGVCTELTGAEVAPGFSRDAIIDEPEVIVARVGTGIETMLCDPWSFDSSLLAIAGAVVEGASVRAGVVIGF